MHPTYTVGAPGLTQSIGGVGVASGGGMRYDAFPLMGQVPHHTVGAHASYVAQPATQYGTYHNTRSDSGLPLSGQTQEQNGRGGFGGGHRRRYPNQGGEQAMTYLQPHYGAGSQLHIPVGAGQAVAYGGQVHPQNRSRGPIVVVPSTRTASSYPDHPRYSGGFTFKLFNDDRTHFIHLPSQYVLVTEGSTRYLGSGKPEQMAPRFTLCRHILQDRVCPRGSLCNFIHGVVSSAEGDPAFRRIEVHKNDAMETGVAQYELLPVGANLVVAYPGEERTINIPSQNVYKTRGSELYLRMLPEGTPQKVPQRCTHYHFKKMCHRGAGCSFIHIAYDTGMLPSISNCAGSEETSAQPNNNEMLQN